jgi:hypothetical protein
VEFDAGVFQRCSPIVLHSLNNQLVCTHPAALSSFATVHGGRGV